MQTSQTFPVHLVFLALSTILITIILHLNVENMKFEFRQNKNFSTSCHFYKLKDMQHYTICHNPLTTKRGWHLIFSYNIMRDSHIKVMRIKEMIAN